jgi:hypothetical protein
LTGALLTGAVGCDLGRVTVDTTSEVLYRAQPALYQESDYELAAQAMPGVLKTIESFWFVEKDNRRLLKLLAEGYCLYGLGFVEDAWEDAYLTRNLDRADELRARATKMFIRCTNYGLLLLDRAWQEKIYGDLETVDALVARARGEHRPGLRWTALGLASTLNHNKDSSALLGQLPVVQKLLQTVIELDDRYNTKNMAWRAMPHIAMALTHSSLGQTLGGDPKLVDAHFRRAMELTDNKYLLARVFYARHYAVMIQDRELYRKTLLDVLQTAPSVWPEQRLANEAAHRRARRYLKYEKEFF